MTQDYDNRPPSTLSPGQEVILNGEWRVLASVTELESSLGYRWYALVTTDGTYVRAREDDTVRVRPN